MLKEYIQREAAAGRRIPAFWAGAVKRPAVVPTQMPQGRKYGFMGARGMAEDIARRAGAVDEDRTTMKKGGKVKKMAKGGSTASKRADGCATKGKTKGRFV